MAYQMEYEFRQIKKNCIRKNKNINLFLAAILLATGMAAARLGGASFEMIFLGKYEEVRAASTQMIDHLRDGMAFDKAVSAFCDEIGIENTEN